MRKAAFAQLRLFDRSCFSRPQFSHNFRRRRARQIAFIGRERDSAYARMAATAIAFADFGQIHHVLPVSPRIRSHRDFHAEAAAAQPDAVHRIPMQIIRNELVVAFQVLIADVKVNGSLLCTLSAGAICQSSGDGAPSAAAQPRRRMALSARQPAARLPDKGSGEEENQDR